MTTTPPIPPPSPPNSPPNSPPTSPVVSTPAAKHHAPPQDDAQQQPTKNNTESQSTTTPAFEANFLTPPDSPHNNDASNIATTATTLSPLSTHHPLQDIEEGKTTSESPSWAASLYSLPAPSTDTTITTTTHPEVFHRLDLEYERAIQDRAILWSAQNASVRQSALLSLLFFILFLLTGTSFYDRYTDWTLNESLLFSIYTITTVGYGNHEIPRRWEFWVFTVFYIFVGIAALTIVVAQAYQFIMLEASRAKREREGRMRVNTVRREEGWDEERGEGCGERMSRWMKQVKFFLRETCLGGVVSVFGPLFILVMLGACVVGPIEGWNFWEAIYWAVVTLTTVGFGDYFPTQDASTWFCIFYLPFSVGFMSIYLAHVAKFYITLSGENVKRLEKKMRRNLEKQRKEEDKDMIKEARRSPKQTNKMKTEGFQSLTMGDGEDKASGNAWTFGIPEATSNVNDTTHRDNVRENSMVNPDEPIRTMKHIIQSITQTNNTSNDPSIISPSTLLTTPASSTDDKPSLQLRVIVLERFAEIIAVDIAGYQSKITIEDDTLSVTIDTIRATSDKWMIPHRARKEFRSVALRCLYFVGERNLITRGAEALFELTPMEFHGLFGGLLAEMGDKTTMENWIENTDILADVELKNGDVKRVFFESEEEIDEDREIIITSDNDDSKSGAISMRQSIVNTTIKTVKSKILASQKSSKRRAANSNPQCRGGVSEKVLDDTLNTDDDEYIEMKDFT